MDDQRHGDVDLKTASGAAATSRGSTGSTASAWGSSAVATAATSSARPWPSSRRAFEVGIDIFGVTNWLRTLESIPPWWEEFKDALYAEMGDPATTANGYTPSRLCSTPRTSSDRSSSSRAPTIRASSRRRATRWSPRRGPTACPSSTCCSPTRGTASARRRTRHPGLGSLLGVPGGAPVGDSPTASSAADRPRTACGPGSTADVLEEELAQALGGLLGDPVAHLLQHLEAVGTVDEVGGALAGARAKAGSPVLQT